jgi:hypothetical protein
MVMNIDVKTGIHYGVIHHAKVGQAWYDESDALFPNKENGEDDDDFEPIGFYIDKDGYEACQGNDDCDIFITKSPFYTICKLCSPCAPNAGYIMDSDPKGYKTYCFGHDWFETNQAPYPVYDVKTGFLVPILAKED